MRLIIILVLVASVFCDRVFDQIFNVMVNQSVDPCDDFYRHVCGVNAGGDLRTLTKDRERIEYLNSTVFDDVSEYMVEIIQYTDKAYIGELISDELRKQFNKACQSGQQDAFLKNVENFFNITTDETITCEGNQEFIDGTLKEINDIFIEEYQSKCTLVLPARHYQLWLYRNPKVVNSMNTLFGITKKASYEWVDSTQWINNRNLNKQYTRALNSTYFRDYNRDIEKMKIFTSYYSDCKKSVRMWLEDAEVIKKICVRETFKINKNTNEPFWSIHTPSPYFAGSLGDHSLRIIKFYEPRYVLANLIQSEALFFGTTGFSMAHEMGHSVILRDDTSRLYFTKNGTSCVQNQIKKSCEYFNEEHCKTNETFREDGCDSFGSQVSTQLAKKLMGQKFYEVSKENEKLTNNQLFFYGQASVLCWHSNELRNNSIYSPNQIRFNSITAQSSEFQKAFHCSPESKMMRSSAEKCYLFGKDAPEN